MVTHTVIFEGGDQDLVTYPINESGEPVVLDPVTYAVVDLRVSDTSSSRFVVSAGTAATTDGTTEATTAVAGQGAADVRKIEVADNTDFLDQRRYVLISPTGEIEELELDHSEATALYSTDRIRGDFPIGSTVRGFSLTASFPTAEAGDRAAFQNGGGPYAVIWTYPAGSLPLTTREPVWMRRTRLRGYASISDVLILDQRLEEMARGRFRITAALRQAHRDFRARLREYSIDPSQYLGGDNARDFVVYRTAAICRTHLNADRDVEMAREYNSRADGLLMTLGAMDTAITDERDDSAAAGSTRIQPSPFGLT